MSHTSTDGSIIEYCDIQEQTIETYGVKRKTLIDQDQCPWNLLRGACPDRHDSELKGGACEAVNR